MLALVITKPRTNQVLVHREFVVPFFAVKKSSLIGLSAKCGRPGLKSCLDLLFIWISRTEYV